MSRIVLTEQQWAFIQPLLPPPARTGRSRANDRRTIEGILYILTTGCRWQDLPRDYGAPTTVRRRLKRWGEAGVWERIWRAALSALDQRGQLDWSMSFVDGSFAPAKNGSEKVGATKKGKGAKAHSGTQLRLAGQFPSAPHPLGASVQRLSEQIRFRCHVAVCAPGDYPRVPDPAGVRHARAVYAAQSFNHVRA